MGDHKLVWRTGSVFGGEPLASILEWHRTSLPVRDRHTTTLLQEEAYMDETTQPPLTIPLIRVKHMSPGLTPPELEPLPSSSLVRLEHRLKESLVCVVEHLRERPHRRPHLRGAISLLPFI